MARIAYLDFLKCGERNHRWDLPAQTLCPKDGGIALRVPFTI